MTNCLPSKKEIGLSPVVLREDSGICLQHVISTKWTKWMHGEIPLQKIVSLLWRELFSPAWIAGVVGFMNSMSFRLSERSERMEKSLYKKLSPFYGTKWSPLLSSTERSPDLSGKGGGLGEDLRSGGNLSHKWETID